MRDVVLRLCFGALIIVGLAACQSATLIDLNREFVSLVQQTEEAKRLHRSGVLDTPNFDAAIEGYRVAFAETGDKAADAAGKAQTPQNKASFLNVAVRSYLKSGPFGDAKIPDLVAQGHKECSAKGMQDLKALPVTCGYFYIAVPQAVNNEWQREVVVLQRRAKDLRTPPRRYLTASEGQRLKRAFAAFIGQLEAIETGTREIDLTNADQRLRAVIYRQQDIFLCNARSTRLLLDDVVKKDGPWEREAIKAQLKQEEKAWVDKLTTRAVKFPRDTCDKLGSPGF